MYVKETIDKYIKSVIPNCEVYHFDNENGKTGFKIDTHYKVNRKQIEDIEKKTDLFLTTIDLWQYTNDPYIELEFIRI